MLLLLIGGLGFVGVWRWCSDMHRSDTIAGMDNE